MLTEGEIECLRYRCGAGTGLHVTLVQDQDGFRIENEQGETLVSASDLLAIVDAIEGGVVDLGGAGTALLAGLRGAADVSLVL